MRNFHRDDEFPSNRGSYINEFYPGGIFFKRPKPLINTFYCISRSLYSQNLGKYVKFVRIVRLPIFCYSFDLRYKFHYHPFPPPGASRRMYMPLILPRKHSKPTFYLKSLKFSRSTLSPKWYWKNKGNFAKLSQSQSPSTVGLCRESMELILLSQTCRQKTINLYKWTPRLILGFKMALWGPNRLEINQKVRPELNNLNTESAQ